MTPRRILRPALVATFLAILLQVLPAGAALADETSNPTPNPSTTALPDDGDGQSTGKQTGKDAPITVGIQTATSDGIDERGKYEYELAPKSVSQDWIAVVNYSDRPADVTLSPRDATTTSDSPFAVQPNGVASTDVGSWIALSKTHLHLAARSQTLVPFQIGVPYNAEPGDHVGAVVMTVDVDGEGTQPESNEVRIDNRVGLRVYLRVPGSLTPQLQINDLKAHFDGSWASFGVGRNTVDYTVKNSGNVVLSGTQVIEMLRSVRLSGIEIDPEPFSDMLPDGEITVHQVSGKFFAVGPLQTRVTVTGSSDEAVDVAPVTAEVSQRVLPWALAVTALVVLILASVLTRLIRRWHKRRPPKVKNPAHRRKGGPPIDAGDGAVGQEPVGAGVAHGTQQEDPA
jgi:hypothetical protein